jgi:hypothetical protein
MRQEPWVTAEGVDEWLDSHPTKPKDCTRPDPGPAESEAGAEPELHHDLGQEPTTVGARTPESCPYRQNGDFNWRAPSPSICRGGSVVRAGLGASRRMQDHWQSR